MKKLIQIIFILTVITFICQKESILALPAEQLESNVSVVGTCEENQKNSYSFMMPDSGYVQFIIENLDYTDTRFEGWLLTFSNDSMEEFSTFKTDDNQNTSISHRYNFKKRATIYLTIQNKYHTTAGRRYKITPIFTRTTSWESESNDSIETATYLAAGKARCGTIYKYNDNDYYVFRATRNGEIKCSLSLFPAYQEKEALNEKLTDWFFFEVLDEKSKMLNQKDYVTQNTSISISVKKGKRYYIRLYSNNQSSIDALYKVRVAYKK